MSNTMPHVKQPPGSALCGAACAAMLLGARGEPYDLQVIWNEVSASRLSNPSSRYCSNDKMVQFFRNRGIQAALVSAKDGIAFLEKAQSIGLHVIINHKFQANRKLGHFSVYLFTDKDGVHVNDPNKKHADYTIPIEHFTKLLGTNQEITRENTFLTVNLSVEMPENVHRGAPLFTALKDDVTAVLNYEKDNWVLLE